MKRIHYLVLGLLLSGCFTLAAMLAPRTATWSERSQSDNVLKVLLGDGRRLFANHFFVQADVTFHSGYYPSIFDRRDQASKSPLVTGHDEHEGHVHDENCKHEEPGHVHDEHCKHEQPKHVHDENCKHDEPGHVHDAHCQHEEPDHADQHEKEMAFLNKPRDWIEAFGRNFIVTKHTHLQAGQEREVLPWLKLSAELDPQRPDTYVVAAYWLRERLGKVQEAQEFLREGLRNNPGNPEILFELGRLYHETLHQDLHAGNIWRTALRRWEETDGKSGQPNLFLYEKIVVHLGRLEEELGNLDRAIQYLELGKKASPNPAALQGQIDELKKRAGVSAQPGKQ